MIMARKNRPLRTRSLNAACYLSVMTGVEAEVVEQDSGLNYFNFERTPEVQEVYNQYREAVANQSPLHIDLIKFNQYVRKYKRATVGR